MIIDFHNQFIYQHIFKTAGTTISYLLSKLSKDEVSILNGDIDASTNTLQIRYGHHHTLTDLSKLFPRLDITKFFIFGFVRNPWDRAVSMYKHYQQDDFFSTTPKERRAEKAREWTFDKFLRVEWILGASQLKMLMLNDTLVANFIGRVENFRTDLKILFEKLGFNLNDEMLDTELHKCETHVYARPEMSLRNWWHYSWWYKDSQIVFVADTVEKEITYFGYTFDDQRPLMPIDIKEEYAKENVDYISS